MITFYVDKNSAEKKDHYSSLSEAINALPSDLSVEVNIKIAPGEYYEKIELRRGNICIEGMGNKPGDTIVYYDDCARMDMPDWNGCTTVRAEQWLPCITIRPEN